MYVLYREPTQQTALAKTNAAQNQGDDSENKLKVNKRGREKLGHGRNSWQTALAKTNAAQNQRDDSENKMKVNKPGEGEIRIWRKKTQWANYFTSIYIYIQPSMSFLLIPLALI